MKRRFALLGLGLALTACGTTTTADGRLTIDSPTLRTEYRDNITGDFVGCDNYQGQPASTQVRVDFDASGFLSTALIRLDGESTNDRDWNFYELFTGTTGLVRKEDKTYTVLFDAVAGTGNLLPAGEGSMTAQGIVVNPVRTIKHVTVENRIGTGFEARVIGWSDEGSATREIASMETIEVYGSCTFVRDTGEAV